MKTLVGLVALSIVWATPALAKEGQQVVPDKKPIEQANVRTNEFSFDTYHAGIQIVRQRTPGKKQATFIAEPYLIEKGAKIVFEIRSVAKSGSVLRWRCIAVNDVAECLGAPVRVRYLPNDTRIVLTANLVPRSKRLDEAVASR